MNTTARSYTTREPGVLDVIGRPVAALTFVDLDAVLNDFDELAITPDGVFQGLAHAEQCAQRKFNQNGGAP